jgi:hypothetical protein
MFNYPFGVPGENYAFFIATLGVPPYNASSLFITYERSISFEGLVKPVFKGVCLMESADTY